VPVLVLPDGEVIDESLDIIRWALSRCDPEGWLQREDAALITANDGHFKLDLDAYKYPERHAGDPLEHRDRGLAFLRQLEFRLSINNQLSGSARGLTDAAIMPFVRQFSAVDRGFFDCQQLPHLSAWLNDHLQSHLFKLIMLPTPPWAASDPPTYFPPFG
jgi:glutathione S-transferase